MSEKDGGALLVFEEGGTVGLIPERDDARKVIPKNKFFRETPLADIMPGDMITVELSTDGETCMESITRHRVRLLPVMENE
jgi:hypothetical protein